MGCRDAKERRKDWVRRSAKSVRKAVSSPPASLQQQKQRSKPMDA